MQNIPQNFKLQYGEEQIQDAIDRMGKDISVWADEVWRLSHTDLLAIPILRGAIFFFADLVRKINHSVEIAPARTWAYEEGQNAAQRSEVAVNILGVPAKGRHVLLVDDICDTGRTLKVLRQVLLDAGALDVRSAVLIKRKLENGALDPEWKGFEYEGPEWFVGYGMDDCDRWRNLSSISIIQQGK